MEFDSPDAAKEFPGLYLAESGKVDDSLEYVDDGDKKKSKKEKKKDKDKGYSALAAESSQDEEDPLDPKSPGKGMKIKAFSKLSGKKKEKDKKSDKSEKEQKKAEKEAKDKRKSEEKERKSLEKELTSTPGPSTAPRPQIPFSGAHLMKANSLNHSASLTPQSSIDRGTPVKKNLVNPSAGGGESGVKDSPPATKPPKEKSAAFNVFLNAPAPILSKFNKDKDKDKSGSKEKHAKTKEHKDKKHKEKDKDKDKGESKSKKEKEHKEKEHKEKDKDKKDHASGMAKVKLKLMRSKNSLEDPNEPPHVTSRLFPEDPEALAKEIKKYEGLLEQAHLQLKSTKKISKKQEEQLWELQRTLTQLKRKLRSINALSSASSYQVHAHLSATDRAQVANSVSPPRPIFKKCDSIDGRAKVNAEVGTAPVATSVPTITDKKPITSPPAPITTAVIEGKTSTNENDNASTVITVVSSNVSIPQEIPKIPLPPSKNSYKAESTLATSPPPLKLASPPPSQVPANIENEQIVTTTAEESKSCRNSVLLSSPVQINNVVTSVTTVGVGAEPACIVASPRPSIDTIAQVHRSSIVSVDKSDTEEIIEEPEQVDEDDDDYLNRRSISNLSIESSQVDSKENIEAVLDDANKMIGSMHEELMFEEAMELVNGDDRLRRSGDHLNDSASRMLGQDDSDVELFTNDLELELPNEEPCPDPFSMPVFDTMEYLSIENEALSMFNEQLMEDLRKEQNDLDEYVQKLPEKTPKNDTESCGTAVSENDYNDLIKVWTQVKSENEVLWDNVNRLRQAVAACKVDEFRLQTRLKYIESKTSALSPVTTTTPLQTEA